jgi:antitoxin PrlF
MGGLLSVFTGEVKTLYHRGMTSTISAKGQITVPKAVRDKLGLRPGAQVEFELTAEGALLRKGHRGGVRAVDRVMGILKREAPTDSLIADMRGPATASSRRRK